MKQKFETGTRVKVKMGHGMWQAIDDIAQELDIRPELKDDIAVVVLFVHIPRSETDSKHSKGDEGYKKYALKFDKYGLIAWFSEDNIYLADEKDSVD